MGIMLALLAAAMLMAGGKRGPVAAPIASDAPDAPDAPEASEDAPTNRPSPRVPASVPRAAESAQKTPPASDGAYSVRAADGSPVGADAAQARKGAQAVADHVRNKKSAYSRPLLAVWQTLAALSPDGLYGPKTAGALRAAGAKNVAGPMFKGAK